MKSFVALSAFVLAVCVVSSQCKSFGNRNINKNVNDNSNVDFLSSFLGSIMNQERKGKTVANRAFPVATAQQAVEQDADVIETAADDTDTSTALQQDEISAIPVAQLKFFQALIAAKAQEFLQ